MRKEMEDLMKECDDLLNECARQEFADLNAIECLDAENLNGMHKVIKLYKKSKELSLKMAEMMDEQNEKLDIIIGMLKTNK